MIPQHHTGRLDRVLACYAQMTLQHIVQRRAGGIEHRRKIDQRKRAYVDLIRDTLNQLKKEGKMREVDVTVATFSVPPASEIILTRSVERILPGTTW